MQGVQFQFDVNTLEPLLEKIVDTALARLDADRAKLDDKLAYSEPEAARLLGLKPHQLRDARLAGKVECSQITGRRIRYTRNDLNEYLMKNRYSPEASR